MLSPVDYFIVVLYFAVTVSLGLFFASRWKGSEDFFLAGRTLTWPVIGLSLFATNISTEHFVGLAAGGNREGLVQGARPAADCAKAPAGRHRGPSQPGTGIPAL